MKKILITLIVFAGMANLSWAQTQEKSPNGISISKFEAGRILNGDDIKFLNIALTPAGATSRGSVTSVNIEGKSYKMNQTLTKEDALNITNTIAKSLEVENQMITLEGAETPTKARGCYYWCWYWYCDYYGRCWKYWYCC